MQGGASPGVPDPTAIIEREEGLRQELSPWQVAMIGLGSSMGTGLFLGSAISVKLAGPAVILSFIGAACIAVTMMWALAEMAAAHPAAGSFGLYAEMYLHPWAGFAVRLTYWVCMMVVVGSEVVAASIYCKFWFPGTPAWVWIGLFSLVILCINSISIGSLGIVEYWLSMIKVVTIVVFLMLGTALLTGVGFPKVGFASYSAHTGAFFRTAGRASAWASFWGFSAFSESKLWEARPAKPRIQGWQFRRQCAGHSLRWCCSTSRGSRLSLELFRGRRSGSVKVRSCAFFRPWVFLRRVTS